jgi:transposase
MFERPAWLTKNQLDILMCICPGPIGHGLTIGETSKRLDISVSSIDNTLKRFKTRFPEAWENLQSMRRAAQRQSKYLRIAKKATARHNGKQNRYMKSLEGMVEDHGEGPVSDMIKERVL